MKILIADDESIIRMGLKAMLQEMGHEVLAARNGREALQMARAHRPDMAILDIKMPFTDGLQAAKTLGRTQPLPILLLTAYSEQDLIEEASDLPIQGYLIKPIEPGTLAAAIAVARKRYAETIALATRTTELARSLEQRKLVDRARGLIMEAGRSEEQAYQLLQQHARRHGLSLSAVAQRVLQEKSIGFLIIEEPDA